jgi:hypothetical protein
MDSQIGFSRSQNQLGSASLPPHFPTWNPTLAVANPWQPHGGRDGGRLAAHFLGLPRTFFSSITIAAAWWPPWRPHGGRRGGRHGGRHAAAVAAAWWPPHGIPIGYGSRVGIRLVNPDPKCSQLAAYL